MEESDIDWAMEVIGRTMDDACMHRNMLFEGLYLEGVA